MINETINLYNLLGEIPEELLNSSYYKALKNKSINKVKFFNVETDFEKLKDIKDDKLFYYLLLSQLVFFIPVDFFSGEIIGFILRSVNNKNFYTVNFKGTSLVYGLNDFKDFKFNEPVILCEGVKDAQAIKLVYKYTLAYLRGVPVESLLKYVNNITNKILIISDNDKTGKILKYKLPGYSIECVKSGKDPGEYFDGKESILIELRLIIDKYFKNWKIK
jgi:hypothetical protein